MSSPGIERDPDEFGRPGTIRLPLLIAIVVVSSMSVLAAALIWQGWGVARRAILLSSERSIVDIGRIIDEKAQRILAPSSVALNQLTRDRISTAETLGERLERVGALARTLDDIPFLSSVYAGYANGDFILVRPLGSDRTRSLFAAPADAAYLAQTVTADPAGGTIGEWRFYDRHLHLLKAEAKADYRFDPRTRPWYRGSLSGPGEHLTPPYVFFTTDQVGVTLSRKSALSDTVIGLDVELADFGEALENLRTTPRTEIAIVGPENEVVAYTDMTLVFYREENAVTLQPLASIGVPALAALAGTHSSANKAALLDVGGETWLGLKVPLPALRRDDVSMLVAVPNSDLLAPIHQGLKLQFWWTGWLILFLLLLGWIAGRRLGQGLTDLTRRAQRLSFFDFEPSSKGTSRIREVRELERVLNDVCATVQSFLTTMETIGRESQTDTMLEKVLRQAVEATGCELGAVYLLNDKDDAFTLAAEARAPGLGAQEAQIAQDLPLTTSRCCLQAGGEDDSQNDGRTAGQLLLPLLDRQEQILGLLLLRHPLDASHGGEEFRAFATKLSGGLSSSIETRHLINAQRVLLDGFVQLIADAIDAKSPYTGSHCRRVPELATMIVDRMAKETDGPYKGFRLTGDERYAFHLGAWLHDCGKVTSPEYVVDKATKLETMYNRIHEIRTRFEVLWRDSEIAHLRRCLEGEDAAASEAVLRAEQQRLSDDFTFVAQCNIGTERISDEAVTRLGEIADRSWLRHFDKRLGLSQEEEQRMGHAESAPLPVREPLLSDRPEQIVPWRGARPAVEKGDPANIYGFDMELPANAYNLGELHNLTIKRGTLTEEERFKVNEHIVQTYIMLRNLSWPRPLARVPEIASTHHERMDGKGYPRRIPAGRLSVEERVIAVADVFEALTAGDRPYKKAKTLSEALGIMLEMAREGHLDPAITRYFLETRLWRDYADRFLPAAQCDRVDIEALTRQFVN